MFENQPKGLWSLALANTGERLGYYTMLAVFLLYLQANFGCDTSDDRQEIYHHQECRVNSTCQSSFKTEVSLQIE